MKKKGGLHNMKRTEEHNRKISAAMQNRKLSDTHREKISKSMKGNQNARKKVSPSE